MNDLTAATVATLLNVSERTVYNHRATLESHYGIELTERVGRRSLFKIEYLGLLQLSVEGKRLPITPDDAPSWTTSEPEVNNTVVDLVDYTVELQPMSPIPGVTIDLDTVDTTMVDTSTQNRLTAYGDLRDAIKTVFLHTVAQDAEVLKAQAKELYANAFSQAAYETLTELMKQNQSK